MEDISIDRAAAACGCSASHFMRWFKAMTAQSFTAFLNEHRLNAAAAALRAGMIPCWRLRKAAGLKTFPILIECLRGSLG